MVPAPSLLLALFFASGFAGLVYELLWVRELAMVFGNTAQGAATTLAVFFLGLSAGQRWAGARVGQAKNPLRVYAGLEALVAATASAYFIILPVYRALSPALLAAGDGGIMPTVSRAALGALALGAPCLCMGATLPVMAQILVRRPDRLAATFAVLYAVQTIGAALGAFAGAFWLPGAIGFRRTYLLAMAISAGVAAVAYLASRSAAATRPMEAAPSTAPVRRRTATDDRQPEWFPVLVAAASGFAALAVEVLWTHMFSQALHNSIYSFAVILVTFLAALSLGGLLSWGIGQLSIDHLLDPLVVLLVASGLAVAWSPIVFNWMTDGLRLFASGEGWGGYVRATFMCAAVVMLGPGILLGSVFPYAVRLEPRPQSGAGAIIGRLASWNTWGAVVGSLWAGFLALPWLGLWASLRATGLLYLAVAAIAAAQRTAQRARALIVVVAGIVLVFLFLDPTRLPLVSLEPGEALRDVRESASGTVAVTETDGVLELSLDGHYVVGASAAIANDRRQAELPMLLHPQPRSVFFLGLGTGITAGAALFHPVDRVTVSELVPDIAREARDYFAPMTDGLFTDPRVHLVIGDGRTTLLADPQHYDVIVSDLFVPWHAGTGGLYTREHFAAVRERLADNGLFAQWLPLYQLSWRDFAVIAHTMLEVFPQVTVWRGDFMPTTPIVALIGQRTPRPLDLAAVVQNVRRRQGGADYPDARARALALLFYAGNLSAARDLVVDAPINTDDQPVIEYRAPMTPMEVVAGRDEWLIDGALSRFWAQLADAVPPDTDPYLASLSADERDGVYAGRMLHDASISRAAGQMSEAQHEFDEFARRVPSDVSTAFSGIANPE